ncbi:hypothetical protein D9758_018816 [Tetrapyrgos nigripes]|uniref:Uncharacterized protein n=1 Tax=Tetrapyrgos nigripes TaxID=182062 RepID=A0A8H5EV87_9AGAR|nr:hypothetical protein D9758_018816 [Tetrapyrgos nigripes]
MRTPSSKIQEIVENNTSQASKNLLKKVQKEVNKGLRGGSDQSNSPSKATSSTSKAVVKAKPQASTQNKPSRFGYILVNVWGCKQNTRGAISLRSNVAPNKSTYDHYVVLGLGASDLKNGIEIPPNLNHVRLVKFLRKIIPAFRYLYPDDAMDVNLTEPSPWMLCSKMRNSLVLCPIKLPDSGDLIRKGTLESKAFSDRVVIIATHEAISRNDIWLKCPEMELETFNTNWETLAGLEGRQDDESMNEEDGEDICPALADRTNAQKRKHDELSEDEDEDEVTSALCTEQRPAKALRRSIRNKSKGKAKAIALSDVDSENEVIDVASELLPLSPVKKITDPWDANRKFTLPRASQ